jgi:hypothetical protein
MKLIQPIMARVTGLTQTEIRAMFGEIYGYKNKGGETLAIIGTIEIENELV